MRHYKSMLVLLISGLLVGCAVPIIVPVDAQLVWVGEVNDPAHVEGITWQQYGQIYMVDDANGQVAAVSTVWPGQPNTRFDVTPHRRYRAYFLQQPMPSTMPALSR